MKSGRAGSGLWSIGVVPSLGHSRGPAAWRRTPRCRIADAKAAAIDGEAGEGVGSGVVAVGHERGRADLAADPDAVPGGDLVADEADHPGCGNPAEVRYMAGMHDPAHRLESRDDRRGGDDQERVIEGVLSSVRLVGDTSMGQARTTSHVLGVGQGFGDQGSDVRVITGVEDEVALATCRDQTEAAELAEVLGDCGRACTDVVGQLVHAVLGMEQCPKDAEASLDGERL